MDLKNLKIGTQLRIGLGAIMLLVALLGSVAWFQASSLWQTTSDLYDHSFTVRRTLSEMRFNMLAMKFGMKELFLVETEQERQPIIQDIDLNEAQALQLFTTLYDRYLGPRTDIDEVYNQFVQWKSIRAETIRLLRAGKRSEALERIKSTGPDGLKINKVISEIQDIINYSLKSADQFYANAGMHKDRLIERLGALLVTIFMLITVIGYLLLKGIKGPLQKLTMAAEQYRNGNLDARCPYMSANELGLLAESFNALAVSVQTELVSKGNSSRIVDVMLQAEELPTVCRELLAELLEQTGSQVCAVYLLNDRKTDFEHFESIGLATAGRASFSADGREGEFGAALTTGQIQLIRDIPEDTHFSFATVSGEFRPREIITIPILAQKEVVAVISLAGVRSYHESALRLVNDTWQVVTARLNSLLVMQKIRAFSEKLDCQNRELDAQKREITAQKDELSEHNVELEMQKKELDEANRLKSAFISNMSHELRTPLNSVIALSGVLNRRLAGAIPDEEYSYLDVIERNGKNLLALINDILDLSRIEAGREELSLSRFSIRELAADVVAMIEIQAEQKDIALLNGVGTDLPLIRSDFDKCRHILQNLVANAVKFTGEGSVEIHAVVVDNTVRISVTDTGIGIAADQLQYIFDEFRQADESTTKNYGGTGLGLSIARKYARLLHGGITVESMPGTGSTFTFRLPLTIDLAANAGSETETAEYYPPARTGRPALLASGTGKCILVVEDNEPAIIQLKDILHGQGYYVQVAKNGREALEQIESSLPDAMILDLMMPEVDGFDVLRSIRSLEKTSQIPVLILTAKHVTREELSFLKGNHIHQLIQKGDVNRNDLLASIGKMVTPQQQPQISPSRTIIRLPKSGKPLILVVEDNPDNMKTIRALLQDSCTVIEAADGKTGLALAQEHKPDLILMDLAMPVMDGFKTLEALRQVEEIKGIPVIAVTASAMAGNREEILGFGFDGYVSKPIDWQLFEATIRETLSGN